MAFHEQFPGAEQQTTEEVLVDHAVDVGNETFSPKTEGYVPAETIEAMNTTVQDTIIASKAARFETDVQLGAEELLKNLETKRLETEALLATMGGAEQAEYKIAQLKLSEEKLDEIVGNTDAWYAKLLRTGKVKSFDEIMNKVHAAFKNSPRSRVNVTDKPTVG